MGVYKEMENKKYQTLKDQYDEIYEKLGDLEQQYDLYEIEDDAYEENKMNLEDELYMIEYKIAYLLDNGLSEWE